MYFEYEITFDDYASAQLLYAKLIQGRRYIEGALAIVLVGLFLCVIAWNDRSLSWPTFLLTGLGLWWIYAGIARLFPSWWYRRAYRQENLAGKRYQAELGEDRFEVSGDVYSWRVRWPGVQVKGENERVFIISAANTIFIFGKRYLSDDQQQELRRLSGIGSRTAQPGSNAN